VLSANAIPVPLIHCHGPLSRNVFQLQP
jgi:hypothetical protein